jgi:hypothetical protein
MTIELKITVDFLCFTKNTPGYADSLLSRNNATDRRAQTVLSICASLTLQHAKKKGKV